MISGILEIVGNGAAFLRQREASYLASKNDIFVGNKLIQRYGLRTGDEIIGEAGDSPGRGKSAPLQSITTVNGLNPDDALHRPQFSRLTAQHPDQQLQIECGLTRRGQRDITDRVIDLFCPFGKGQRALIVAPAKAGKTMVLQAVAEGVIKNHPTATVFILLVDERPEEITDMEMCGYGEVIASSFDHPAERHVSVAEITLERAKRRVEMGQDVVIILDSITRLARAYNTSEEGSGRTMSGGLDANSLEKPKRFLGAARQVDPNKGGGSLTIIATALVDTGSRMDQVIFEEFKGTGNSELLLSRELADKRIFPAIDIVQSSTRKEEMLLSPEALEWQQNFRRQLAGSSAADAMQQLHSIMKRSNSNDELVGRAVAV
ncbi:MAG TPA: transcription termination factor Rho [Longimicrobiales bacterium]|nr:transcription termination factor Rho [Longimicrobiales bacterium]